MIKNSVMPQGSPVVLAMLTAVFLHQNATGTVLFEETDLVSDIVGRAANTDPNLVNPWGIASSATSPFWVADNKTGVSSIYSSSGVPQALVVTVPPPAGGQPPSAPTGIVFNGGAGFELQPGFPARFIFATEDGTISGWNPAVSPTSGILKVDNSPAGSVYKGLALGNNGSGDFLYAANFKAGQIDVFGNSFAAAALGGSFTDPNLPAGYGPFNVQNLNGKLYVTYALQDGSGEDDVAGPGHGFVDVFDLNGSFEKRLVSQGPLNSPWGLEVAPSSFGSLAGSLLVGNFGDGMINAFDLSTGAPLGPLLDSGGNPLQIEGLWGLKLGNGGNGGDSQKIYFTAGIAGNDSVEDHGLFGVLAASSSGNSSSVPDSPVPLWLNGAVLLGILGLGHARWGLSR